MIETMKTSSTQKTVLAVLFYIAFTGWLFFPWLDHLRKAEYIFLLTCPVAAIGTYLLSRRWVYSFWASLLAGIIYGLGPFAVGLLCYHPLASLIYAAVPFSLLPAAFAPKLIPNHRHLSALLAFAGIFAPFIFIITSFAISAALRFYPLPLNTSPSPQTFLAILNPFAVRTDCLTLGVFHVPLAFLVVGMALLFKSKKLLPILIFAVALAAAFYKPIFNVPPAFWLSPVVLIISIIIAVGFQTLILAGRSDSFWLAISVCVSAAAAIATLIFAKTSGTAFLYSAQLHGLSAITVLTIFFITRISFGLHKTRLLILLAALGVDIIMTATLLMRAVF
ncbi:MAG: hypothetical protein K8R02_08950 [Anaerohalosphaeraceae bacterium]|nr:hypothetical protein [Anaerohalosphaeraceae bacterium]